MFIKNNSTWQREINYEDSTVFKNLLDKLKTYSKSFKSASYSTTSTLSDVYENIKYQHTFWVQLTNFAPDNLFILGKEFKKGEFYNLLKDFDTQTLINSTELKELIKTGWLKTANSKLFEDILNPSRKDWFCFYEPKKINQYISEPFDFLVIKYNLKDPLEEDIDTRTALVNTNYQGGYIEDGTTKGMFRPVPFNIALDSNDLGFSRGTTISSTSGTAGNTYLKWGGDNVTSKGSESVLIDFKRISKDLNYLQTISVRLRAYFFTYKASGLIELELSTYKGGVMNNIGTDFVNVGGVLVQNLKSNRIITTENNSDVDGDDLGTIVYNTNNSNAILTDMLNTDIANENLSFQDLFNSVDFNAYTWDMGTSGYNPDNINYTDMLIPFNFDEKILEKDFQHSDSEWGYGQRNVFNSDKVWKKLLNHFFIIDLATTENINLYDINKNNIPYSIIDIDDIRVVNEHRVLFKNQTDPILNGVYVYRNSIFTRDVIFDTDEDLKYFSCFIKEGNINKNKEYFLDRKENGEFPIFNSTSSLCECKCDCSDITLTCVGFNFKEGNNYVLRNRSSYKLLAEHVFTDSDYFVQKEPIIDVDFTNRYFDNGTHFNLNGTAFFEVSKDFENLNYYFNGELHFQNKAGLNTFDKLYPKIEVINNDLYFLRNNNELVKFIKFNSIINEDIFNSIIKFDNIFNDFQMINSTSGYFINLSSNNQTILNKIEFNNGNIVNSIDIVLENNATEIKVIDNFIFYLTYKGIFLNYKNNNYLIKEISLPIKLRVEDQLNNISLYYLIDDFPNKIEITKDELINIISWKKNEDYLIRKFSKKKIDIWEINSTSGINNLYLKGTQITNLNGTNYFIDIPKVSTTNSRFFDGIDDYIDLNLTYDFNLNKTIFQNNISLLSLQDKNISNGSFTVEFKIKPDVLKVNQSVFYFGNESKIYTFKVGNITYRTPISPVNYITFNLDSGDGFPIFIITKDTKTINIKSNTKLVIGSETTVSFSWNYNSNKTIGELYFDGILVGSFIDQKSSTNIPIDIRTLGFDKNFIGKSEIIISPSYKGEIREFRLWKISLNNSQIITRLNKDINKDNENFLTDLIGYWKLNDPKSIEYNLAQGNNFYKAIKDKLSLIGAGFFIGGLNNDIILREIQQPQLIQLDINNLYLLDKKTYDNYDFELNKIQDLSEFNKGTTGVLLLSDPTNNTNFNYFYLDTNNSTLSKDITTLNRWGVNQVIQTDDIIEVEVETYYIFDLANTSGNSTGGSLSLIYGTSGISLNKVITKTTNLIPNQWNKLNLNYTFPNINIINVDIQLSIDNNPSYFRNLKYKIIRNNPVFNIYKLDLKREKFERIRNENKIDSIYLEIEKTNPILYTLENNNIFSYQVNFSNLSVNSFTSGTSKDISVINNKYFYLDTLNDIWENNNKVYDSTSSFIETIYGVDDLNINKTIIYYKYLNNNIDILSRNISSSSLNLIATYPLLSNDKIDFIIIDGTNSTIKILEIKNSKVYYDNILLDSNNMEWNFNLKEIWGVFKKDDTKAYIGSKTISNEIKIWLFDIINNSIHKISNYNNNSTLFISDGNLDLDNYKINNVEWIEIINDKDIYFYQLEKDNKVNYKKLVQKLTIDTNKTIKSIQNKNSTTNWLLSTDELNNEYLFTFTNSTTGYNLWKDTLEVNLVENGILIGESGILFKDITNQGTNGTSFNLEFINIIYKDDLFALDSIKTKTNRDLGFKVKQWNGIIYLVGNLGRIIKTIDNGNSWVVLNSNNFNDLKGVSFFNKNDGLIVGLNNTILATFSGGDTFIEVQVPENIGIRDFYDVKYYDNNKALVVGSLGTVLHLSKNNFNWKIDKILNNVALSKLEVSIKDTDLNDKIDLIINKETDFDLYRQTVRKIEYLGDSEFLLVGDNNLLNHLKLTSQITYLIPTLNFLQSKVNSDWVDIKSFDDLVKNEKRAFVVKNNQIYSFEWDHFNQNDNINIVDIELSLYKESSNNIKTISIGNNSLIYAGERVSVCKEIIFSSTSGNSEFIYSNNDECLDLSKHFKPKMLFLDYYLGRKINIHLPDGSYEIPKGNLDKNKLKCFYFRENEYLEFTDFGTTNSQNNFLTYQDHYLLNRRILDQPNSWGKTQQPYNKYNKRITSIDNYNTEAIWEGEFSSHGTNSKSIGFEFINEAVTDLKFYKIPDLREDSITTKLRLGWDGNENSYSTTGLVSQSIILFSDQMIDINLHRYIFRVNHLLGLVEGELIKLDFSNKLYFVRREFTSSGFFYVEADGITLPSFNYTGKITKVNLDIFNKLNIGDVINLISLDKDRNVELELSQKIYLEIRTNVLNIGEIGIVEEKDINTFKITYNFKEFNTIFDVEFVKGSTIDEVLLELKKSTSFPVQIAKTILETRCKDIGDDTKVEILELIDYNFLTTFKTITDFEINSDNNKLYSITSDKNLFVIDINDNNVNNIINLTTVSKFITYNPFYKYLYITGGSLSNKNINVVNTITNTNIATINVGDITIKSLFNPINNYMYIPTNSNILIYNGLTHITTINQKVIDLIFIKFNNLIYTISVDNKIRVYNVVNLFNTINLTTSNLLKLIYDEINNRIYITSLTGVHILNLVNNNVSFISVPKGINISQGVELINLNFDNSTKQILLVSNANLTDTNFYITLIDRETNSIIKEIYTDISVQSIKYNIKENLIYLGGKSGQILIITPVFELDQMDINLDIDLYNILSGNISNLFYNNINGRIYPVKSNTYEISYILASKFEPININIELNNLITDTTSVVRHITPDNKISLCDLFTDEMVYELNSVDKKLIFKNLNYFNGDLLNLKTTFDKHLLSESYNLIIDNENVINIEGNINDLTKYYNLETYVKYATYGTNSILNIDTISIKYNTDVIYGPNYSLLTFLKNVNSIFTNNYTFNLPTHSYTYNDLIRTALGEFKEFTISKNTIFIGNDLISIKDFKSGIFIDVVNNLSRVNRVYIKNITVERYINYPNKLRYIITTDKMLETNLDLVGNITLRGRNKLSEISMDLEFTDDLMLPISNNGTNGVELFNNTYFNNQVTSFQYAKIIMNDDNIRKYISSVIFLDEDNDWNLNVINWKNDPNFFYRPLELFEVGIDKIFKKSITIDSSNYLTKGNTLSLMNVDFNKFNYRIVDGMTLKELEDKFYWVLNADIRNAIIGEDTSGFVWYQGDWIAGTWETGTWYSGKAFNIEWIKGNVFSNKIINNFNLFTTIDDDNSDHTIWYYAIWGSGNFNNGTWNNGIWNKGQFKGVWKGGLWKTGIWSGKSFEGGDWLSGTWLQGTFSQNNSFSIWHSGIFLGGDFENGTWLNGIFDQTDRLPSRFGTKASLLNNAIWEYGWWKNGEFYSGLNSNNYKFSIWKNGTWEKGTFFGGQFEMGVWKNGVWENGFLKSNLEVKEFRVRFADSNLSGKNVEVEFTSPHYYKDLTIGIDLLGNNIKLPNYFMLLGEPEIIKGNIHPNTELLGYNTSAGRHDVVEILDDFTVLININDNNFPYEITNGTSGFENNINLIFESGTNYFIGDTDYNKFNFGNNSERLIYANKYLALEKSYLDNKVSLYDWGSKNPVITNFNINKPIDILWHRKSNKTFITSGYLSTSDINNTSISVLSGTGSLIQTISPLYGVNYLNYDNVNDEIIITSRSIINSSSSGNPNRIYFLNPYDYTYSSLILTNINSDIINEAKLNKPYINSGTSFYSLNYRVGVSSVYKSALLRIDNKTRSLSYKKVYNETNLKLEGFDRKRDKIFITHSTSGVVYLNEIDTLFGNEINILSSTSGHLFSKYLENTKETFIIDGDKLYLYDGELKKIKDFNTSINSIIWSENFSAYFIALNEGVKVLSKDKKAILYTYDIINSFDFAELESKGDNIYVVSKSISGTSGLFLIKNDICKKICTDYSIFKPILVDSEKFNFDVFQYKGVPHIATHWLNGKFKKGIWDFGYWVNGTWNGGIWLDGVFDNGVFGSE